MFMQLFAVGAGGFLGAITTFSAFSLDNMELLRLGEYKMLAINIILNVVLTLFLVLTGFTLSKKYLDNKSGRIKWIQIHTVNFLK